MPSRPLLFEAFPSLKERIPWLPLGRFPTRVERVQGLLPSSVELWVKRDDESGERYGGNKVRKLEFLLAEARAAGARRLATLGGYGSHHVLATAVYGTQAGFEVDAVVFPQPITAHVKEQILADAATGARLIPTGGYLGVPFALWRARRQPGTHWIAPGGSSVAGSLGYVEAALEIGAQVASGELPRPDVVYVALGSCGTAAGLYYGNSHLGASELVAVRVVDRAVSNARLVRGIARKIGALVGAPMPPLPSLRVEHRFFGGRYGRATSEAEEACAAAARVGLHLEPTYTGKTMAALLSDARAGRLDGKRVLYVHTYSGVDLAPLLARAPVPASLPPRLRQLFEEAPATSGQTNSEIG